MNGSPIHPQGMRSTRLILSLAALWFMGLGLAYFRHHRAPEPRAGLVLPATNAALSCADVYRIGVWSEARFGGARAASSRSHAFMDRALLAFVEKLDPFKLLFTEADLDRFRTGGRAAWRRFLKDRKCDYFDTWPSAAIAVARVNLNARLDALPVEQIFAAASADGAAEDLEAMPPPRNFSRSQDELRERLRDVTQRLAAAATPQLLAAYGGDRRRYVRDSLEQLLFENNPAPRDLLAKAFLGAFDGYSTFLPATEFDDFYVELAGGSSGVGIRIRRVPRGLLVEKVLAESAAARNRALRPGDLIVAIDTVPVVAIPPRLAKRLLSGPEGSTVRLKVERPGKTAAVDVAVERKRFAFEEAKIRHEVRPIDQGPLKGKSVAFVEVPSFYGRGGTGTNDERSSAEDVQKIVSDLVQKKGDKLAAMVLDLRGNPGGYLEEAVAMAGIFLGERTVVAVVEKDAERVMRDSRLEPLYRGPLVVLVDEESASAAEVLAGALKDHQRAVVVGAPRSYGKGSVQKLFHLDDELTLPIRGRSYGRGTTGAVVKLTTSLFYSPLGHSPSGNGVKSHIALLGDAEAHTSLSEPVPDLPPFLENDELRQVREKAPLMDRIVGELKAHHKTPVAKDGDTTDEVLSIATEYAALVNGQRGITVSSAK